MSISPISPAFRTKLDQDRFHNHRLGSWLPSDRKVIVAWTKQLMDRIRAHPRNSPLDPTLVALQDLVDGNIILKPLSDNMFTEVPDVAPYNQDPTHNQELRSFSEMLEAFNVLLTMGPQWNDIANKVGLIGCPFNAILDWPMASRFPVPLSILLLIAYRGRLILSPFIVGKSNRISRHRVLIYLAASGYMFFLYPSVNARLKDMLDKWEQYLVSADSIEVLLPPNGVCQKLPSLPSRRVHLTLETALWDRNSSRALKHGADIYEVAR